MNRFQTIAFYLTLAISTLGHSSTLEAKINVILFLADDLGAAELGCYGNQENKTPNIDRMAAEGVRLDTFYAMPLCTTTRMALMTGQYGFRNGYLGMQDKSFIPAPKSPQRDIGWHFTIGDLMQSAKYKTALIGKWQLSGSHPKLIHEAGFDEYRMWAYQHNLPAGIAHEGRWEGKPGNSNTARYWHPSLVENGEYIPTKPDDYGPDLLNNFCFDFMKRNRSQPFFIYYTSLLTHGPHEETPNPIQPGSRLPKGFKSNLEYLDFLMGRLLSQIKKEGLEENTLVLFIGDNGTASRGKGSVTELGARVPFIAWGPGIVKAKPGAERALADLTDIMPTLSEIAGATLPIDRTFDGKSLFPLLTGATTQHRDWIYSHLNDGQILREKNWLLELPGKGKPEKFYNCGESRDGMGYRIVESDESVESLAARERFAMVLAKIPKPEPRKPEPNE